MSVPFNYASKTRLIACDPAPEIIGFTPFDTLVHGSRVYTRPFEIEGMHLHIPKGIYWLYSGWQISWQRNLKETKKFVSVSEAGSLIAALQQAWQILTLGLRTTPRAHARRRTSHLETPYVGMSCQLCSKWGYFYVAFAVSCPVKGGGVTQVKRLFGNVNSITKKDYEQGYRQAVALRNYIESCMKAGFYVDEIDWDAPVPPAKRVSIRPTLEDMRAEAWRRSLKAGV